MNLKGSKVLVTGGAVRIGRAISLELASRGCNIIIHYNNSSAEAKKLADDIRCRNVDAWLVRGDLSSEVGCLRVLSAALKNAGDIDFLVNNAAVFHKDSLLSTTARKFKDELDVNFMAPIVLTNGIMRHAVKKSRKLHVSPVCKVVNLLDRRIAGSESGCLPYLLSKKMLAEFTRSAALELAPCVTVNGVAPGAVLSPPRGRGAQKENKRVRDLAGRIPMEKRCSPEDVARAVTFLLESDGITGQVIYVDGGQHLLGSQSEF